MCDAARGDVCMISSQHLSGVSINHHSRASLARYCLSNRALQFRIARRFAGERQRCDTYQCHGANPASRVLTAHGVIVLALTTWHLARAATTASEHW